MERAAELRDALCSLRGTEGGFARSHRGLAAFWRSIAEDVLPRPAPKAWQALRAELDGWLEGGPPCALVVGPDPASRTSLLARWALSVAERRAAEVIFVPISPRFATAVERDALKLFFGLFKGTATAMFSRPRSPGELMAAIRLALLGVGWVSSIPDADNPHLLVVLDGLERAADGWPDPRAPFLSEPGEGVHIVASVDAEEHASSGAPWRDRLAWSAEEMALIACPADLRSPEDTARAPRAPSSSGVLDALAAVLAPVSPDDLVRAVGVSPDEIEALDRSPNPARELVLTNEDGTCCFRDEALRARWAAEERLASIEDAIVERGLSALHEFKANPDPRITWPVYLVEYLGAHMTRRTATVADRMALVSPAWLELWLRRPGGLVGFLADVRRARRAAEDALFEACGPQGGPGAERERAALIDAIVRCALVEGSLCAKEGSRHEARDPAEPYTDPTVDLARSTGAARSRAEAVVTFASALSGPERDKVLAWAALAEEALDQPGEILPRPIPSMSLDGSSVDPERTFRIRELGEEPGGYLERDEAMIIRPTGLSPEEAWRLAASRTGEARMVAFSAIVPDLSEQRRDEAVSEVVQAYVHHGDRQALRILSACAPWMALGDAARVLCDDLGNQWTGDLQAMLVGFGSLTELIPLLRRLGGTAALVSAANAIIEVGQWLP